MQRGTAGHWQLEGTAYASQLQPAPAWIACKLRDCLCSSWESSAALTVVDGHAEAADGEDDRAGSAEEVELAQAGDVGQLGDDELDGAKDGNPGLQGDPAGLQLLSSRPSALWVVQAVYSLQEASALKAMLGSCSD